MCLPRLSGGRRSDLNCELRTADEEDRQFGPARSVRANRATVVLGDAGNTSDTFAGGSNGNGGRLGGPGSAVVHKEGIVRTGTGSEVGTHSRAPARKRARKEIHLGVGRGSSARRCGDGYQTPGRPVLHVDLILAGTGRHDGDAARGHGTRERSDPIAGSALAGNPGATGSGYEQGLALVGWPAELRSTYRGTVPLGRTSAESEVSRLPGRRCRDLHGRGGSLSDGRNHPLQPLSRLVGAKRITCGGRCLARDYIPQAAT